MRNLVIVLILGLFQKVNAQAINEVSLVVSSQGSTIDIAKQNALRSAVEQAFGAFVSAKTEILNDELIKDEVVSISNGNVKEYEVLNQLYLEDQKLYLVNIRAVVSLEKLASFVQSKGYNDVSFDGSNFAMNMKLQRLNESSELVALKNILVQGLELGSTFFDQKLVVGQPTVSNIPGEYQVPLQVHTELSKNWDEYFEYLKTTLIKIAMTETEIDSYKNVNKKMYTVVFVKNDFANNESSTRFSFDASLHFRNSYSIPYLISFFIKLNCIMLTNFSIIHDLDSVKIDFEFGGKHLMYPSLKTHIIERSLDDDSYYNFDYNFWVLNNDFYNQGLPFNCSASLIERKEKSKSDENIELTYWSINSEAVSYSELEPGIIEVLQFWSPSYFKGEISDSSMFENRDFFSKIIKEIVVDNGVENLDNISNLLLSKTGVGELSSYFNYQNEYYNNLFFARKQNYFGELKINLTFTEEQLEQIKGFKLQKKNN